MYDIIGDIHGYAETLKALLFKMGYSNSNGYFSHSKRKAVFVGDFIDRGPRIRETIDIIKSMYENNSAYVVLGNHEFNAIAFHEKDENGNYYREHSDKNIKQHSYTIAEFINCQTDWIEYLKWFKQLPLFLEFPDFRVVHACWDCDLVDFLKKNYTSNLSDLLFKNSFVCESKEYFAIEYLLKGKELNLPENIPYIDKDGFERHSIRYQWWKKIENHTYQQIAVNYEDQIPNSKLPTELFNNHKPYLESFKPVFIGHYWKTGNLELLQKNVCCVDFSIAKHGVLAAYRFDGEQILDNSKFISTNNID